MSPDKNTGATAVVSVPASTISSSIDHQQATQQQQQASQLQHRSNVVTSISASSAVTSVVALATSTHTESNGNSNSSNNTANSQNLPPPGTGIPSSVLSTPVSILQIVPTAHPLSQSSVIQSNTTANQQSVIQATSGAASTIQLASGKNVILLNTTAKHQNHPPGSVIQTVNASDTSNDANIQLLNSRGEIDAKLSAEEAESKKRREVLERRPSYRKILNDLSSTDLPAIAAQFASDSVIKNELPSPSNEHSHQQHSQQQQQQQQQQSTTGNIVTPGASAPITVPPSYLKVLPAPTIQLAPASQEHSLSTLSTAVAVTNPNTASTGSSPGTIVQYAGQDAHGFFLPVTPYANGGHFNPSAVTVSPEIQYQIRSGNNSAHLPTGAMMSNSTGPGEEATKKRELRLQKNREAAKECRRKKKEYIKCLENRVAVLEKQNQALIEELKSLKELYCAKSE